MSGDCDDVALELVVEALGAYVAGLSPRRQIEFVKRLTDGLERPILLKEAQHAGARAKARELWGQLVPRLLRA